MPDHMMPGEPAKEPVKLYLDDQVEPFKVSEPPIRFRFSTIHLPDGPHTLRIEASNGLAPPTVKAIPFSVRNGVALSLSGLQPNQTIGGQVELIINAYAGNTEVDFEPKQAETPQPVPTWAWVLLLAVMSWAMYYIVTPHSPGPDDSFKRAEASPMLGRQIFDDTCARCHGEDGRGRVDAATGQSVVAALRNTKELGVARSPFKLLSRVVTGVPGTQMPAWGPQLSNGEIVAAVNHVRTWWGHDASTIDLAHRYPPKEIEVLECNIAEAMKAKDSEQMKAWAWPTINKPVLFRNGDDKGGYMGDEVHKRWNAYFEALCDGKIRDFKLREVRYDYEADTVDQEGAVVIAMGRVYLESISHGGLSVSEKGRFIRVYQRKNGLWNLALDFADIPFQVGCDPALHPGGDHVVGEKKDDPDEGLDQPPAGDGVGFAQIVEMFTALDKNAKSSPHGNFWNEPYQEFVDYSFDFETDNGDVTIRLITPFSSKTSNMVHALESGKGLVACTPTGQRQVIDLPRRMPVGTALMTDENVAKLKAWIDAGCPEVSGQPTTQSNVPPEELLCPGGGGGGDDTGGVGGRKMLGSCASLLPPPTAGAAAPQGNGGFPVPKDSGGGGFPAPKDAGGGGFPAPKDAGGGGFPAPKDAGGGGFPAPKDAGGGGFPAPANPPKDPGGGGFPAPANQPKDAPGGGFPAPANPPKDAPGGGGFPAPDNPPKDPQAPDDPTEDPPKDDPKPADDPNEVPPDSRVPPDPNTPEQPKPPGNDLPPPDVPPTGTGGAPK